MMSQESTVFVVDDDPGVRVSLSALFESVGIAVRAFGSARAFLDAYENEPGCLVLDLSMPGMSGTELQEELAAREAVIPIVFLTGYGDIPLAVRCLHRGAITFMPKPAKREELLASVKVGFERDLLQRQAGSDKEALKNRFGALSPRELEVLDLLVDGDANKVIATRLIISERTVEKHRANIMHKADAGSLAELTRMWVRWREHTEGQMVVRDA